MSIISCPESLKKMRGKPPARKIICAELDKFEKMTYNHHKFKTRTCDDWEKDLCSRFQRAAGRCEAVLRVELLAQELLTERRGASREDGGFAVMEAGIRRGASPWPMLLSGRMITSMRVVPRRNLERVAFVSCSCRRRRLFLLH